MKLSVLIADDEPLICRLVQALADWDSLDMKVADTAQNGLEALEKIKSLQPDILITDIRMPGLGGLELVEKAKALKPDLQVIIISGYAHFEYAQSAIKFGVGNYLLKPINKEELMETLAVLGKRCRENQEKSKKEVSWESSQKDRERIRASLIKELKGAGEMNLAREQLGTEYYFSAKDWLLVFLLKIDHRGEKMNRAAAELIREKARSILLPPVLKTGCEAVFEFEGSTGFGIVSGEEGQKDAVRKAFREGINELEAKKHLFGEVEFSLALGGEVKEPQQLKQSLRQAESVLLERWIEGTGKVLHTIPEGCEGKQEMLDTYSREMKEALEKMSLEDSKNAVCGLRRRLLHTPGVCGRDVEEVAGAAGRLFVSQLGSVNMENCLLDFTSRIHDCSSAKAVFDELEHLTESLIEEFLALRKSEAQRPVRIARQYVMEHFGEPITLEEVCEKTGFSVSYFSALFKKETGEGFLKYLTRVRMEEAKTLLRETNLPVAEICERVGYSDRKHFTSVFHKMSGLNPAEYRKLYG